MLEITLTLPSPKLKETWKIMEIIHIPVKIQTPMQQTEGYGMGYQACRVFI